MFGILSLCIVFLWPEVPADSLLPGSVQSVWERQEEHLEDLLENAPEEYEEALAELQGYADRQINLHTAQAEDLQRLGILDPWQIKALLQYRDSYGKIVRLEELAENVPGFDTRTLQALAPFVCLDNAESAVLPPLKKIIAQGKHHIMARYGRALKASKAYTENKYAGTPDNAYLRYNFDYKNRILIGFAAKQGAGEAFTCQGFDFYSGYLSLKSFGALKNLTIGNYKADFGFGLNIHSPDGFFGGAQTGLLSSGGQGIRPYASGAEYGFLQGVAAQFSLPASWQASLFYSFDRHDAGLQLDTLAEAVDFWDCIQSFPETGYHRTPTEINNKEAVSRQVFGLAVEKDIASARVGFLASGYQLGGLYTPEHRTGNGLYSQVKPALGGNLSVYYQWLLRRFHFYGEAAVSHTAQAAVRQGIQYKPAETFAFDVRYTWQSAGYYAAYAAVGNKRLPRPAVSGTEKHLFVWQGQVLLPADFRLEFSGSESIEKKNAGMPVHSEVFNGSLYYEPRRLTAYLRFRFDRTKTRNGHSLRLNAVYHAPNGFFTESRLELRDFSKGILLLQDAGYNAPRGGFRIRLRLALFHTESYDCRIYAYEHDLRYAASSPALYGKGMRFFVLVSQSFGRFTAEIKYAHTLMDGVQSIGSGDNTVQGFLKPEIKVQLHWKL